MRRKLPNDSQLNELYLVTGSEAETMKLVLSGEWVNTIKVKPSFDPSINVKPTKYDQSKRRARLAKKAKIKEPKPPKPPKVKKERPKPTDFWSRFKEYNRLVWEVTKLQPLHELKDYDKRGFRGFHVDHILSVFECFKRGLSPSYAGHISNLRMIPSEQNLKKGRKTVYTDLFGNDLHPI